MTTARGRFSSWRDEPFYHDLVGGLRVYTGGDLPGLIARLKTLHSAPARDGAVTSPPGLHSR